MHIDIRKTNTEWFQPGQTVALVIDREIYERTVSRLTATLIVLDSGVKFAKKDFYQVGGSANAIYPLDHEYITKISKGNIREETLKNLRIQAQKLISGWGDVDGNLAKLQGLITEARQTIADNA